MRLALVIYEHNHGTDVITTILQDDEDFALSASR